MKSLSIHIISCATAAMTCLSSSFAQSKNENNIPQQVLSSFKIKYPTAIVKKWKVDSNIFIAKTIIDNHKCLAVFDRNGNWTCTATKITWPWGLPKAVTKGYRKSGYYAWHIYSMTKFDKPTGQYYQIIVDDRNQQIDASHQAVLTTEKLLEYKADGTFIRIRDISNDSLATMAGN